MKCPTCKQEFTPSDKRRRFCCYRCWYINYYKRNKKLLHKKYLANREAVKADSRRRYREKQPIFNIEKSCIYCGKIFIAKRKDIKFCSISCKNKLYYFLKGKNIRAKLAAYYRGNAEKIKINRILHNK